MKKKIIKPKSLNDIAKILSNTIATLQTDTPNIVVAQTTVDASRAFILTIVTAKRFGNLKSK